MDRNDEWNNSRRNEKREEPKNFLLKSLPCINVRKKCWSKNRKTKLEEEENQTDCESFEKSSKAYHSSTKSKKVHKNDEYKSSKTKNLHLKKLKKVGRKIITLLHQWEYRRLMSENNFEKKIKLR